MVKPTGFDEPIARLIEEEINKLIAGGVLLAGQLPQHIRQTNSGVLFRNNSSETVPPYGLMQIVETEEVSGRLYHVVDKFDEDVFGGFLFNWHRAVPAGETGMAQRGEPNIAAGDGSTVTFGQLWGPEPGEWTITPNGGPWVVTGENSLAEDAINVLRDIATTYRGVVTTQISARSGSTDGSGVVSLKTIGASNVTDPFQSSVDVTSLLSDTIAADAEVVLARTTNGRLQVIAEDCGE